MSNECGDCSLCCKLLGIKELDKPKLQWCSHCSPGNGCKIYQDRPQSCREFECMWLMGQWHEDFKPSKVRAFFWRPADHPFGAIQCEVDPDRNWRGGTIEVLARNLSKQGYHIMVRQGEERFFFRGEGKPLPKFKDPVRLLL